jgi:transposase-like protein
MSFQAKKNWDNEIFSEVKFHKTVKGTHHDSDLTTIKRLSKCDKLNTWSICKNCGIEYPIRISEITHRERFFCSMKCAGIFNRSKRSPTNKKDINPEKVQTLIDQGLSISEISIIFGCSRGPIVRVIKESKLSFKKQVAVNFAEHSFPAKGGQP